MQVSGANNIQVGEGNNTEAGQGNNLQVGSKINPVGNPVAPNTAKAAAVHLAAAATVFSTEAVKQYPNMAPTYKDQMASYFMKKLL